MLRTGRGAWDHVATVQAEGHVVRAVAASGRVMWTRGFDAPVTQVERADLDGDGEVETAVAVVPASGFYERTRDPQHSEILILDASGAVRDRFQPDKTVNRYESHPIVPPLFIPRLFLADLDGDRHPDLVVNCRHRTLGLAALFGYWGKTRRWELLLNHPGGWIFHLAAVPGAEPPRLRFLAFNSLIGSHAVLGEIAVGQPPEASIGGTNALVGASAGAALAWYTPLDPSVAMLPADDQPGFGVDAQGASTFSLRGVPLMVDRFGNPTPGPNSGRDLRLARVGFMQAMGELAQGTRSFANAGLALAERQHLRTEFSQLMLEPAHRSILDLEISRCLDRAGAIQEAVALLRERSAELRYDGLGYWLAHTQALAGDLDGAVKTAEATIANANTSVGTFLAPRLLLRLAIERRDAALFRRILPIFMRGQPPEILAAVEARAHLWWDEADGGDCRVRSFDLVPDGEPIACLARWRLGRTTPDDPDRMQAAIKTNPDTEIECLSARAMALLARGEPAGALLALDRAEAALSTAGRNRWDFTWMQNEQLVRACRVGALVAAGRREEATRLVRELRPTLRRGLLPARLVDDAVRDLAAVRNAAVLRQAH